MPTFREILAQTKKEITEATPVEVNQRLQSERPPILIDIREPEETHAGIIPDALVIPRGFLEQRVEAKVPDRDQPVVLYCASGNRSAFAAKSLNEMGYTEVSSMSAGFNGWKDAGFKFAVPQALKPAQAARYSRHTLLPGVGESGQLKLLEARSCSSVRAGSAHRPAFTSPPPGWARSTSSISTSSTSPTCSARYCTRPSASEWPRPSPPRSR